MTTAPTAPTAPSPSSAMTTTTMTTAGAVPAPTATVTATADADATVEIRRFVVRALQASASRLRDTASALDAADKRRHQALDRWFAGFAAEVRAHHELIESAVLPRLAERGALDDRLLDTIAADHAWVDQLLGELGDALGIVSFGLGESGAWIAQAGVLAAELDLVLTGQLAREERVLAPRIEAALTAAERVGIERSLVRGITLDRAAFAMTWLHDELDDVERAALLRVASGASRLIWRSRRRAYRRSTSAAFARR